MADGRGGYRPPRNPAPVSGPGALSQRTDGGPADKRMLTGGGRYGETKALAEFQSGAPMTQDATAQPPLGAEGSPLIGLLDQPTQRPDEPVTFGADAGEGPGAEALGIPDLDSADVQAILPYLKDLEWLANQPTAKPSTRAMIRRIKGLL